MTGSGLPAPNGPARAIVATSLEVGAGRADRAVDQQRLIGRAAATSAPSALFEIGAEARQRVLAQRHAGRHGVAAALDQQALGDRLAHHAAEIDAGDRAARAGADAARLERDRKGRPAEPLLQPRGDQPDHAGMPAFARR